MKVPLLLLLALCSVTCQHAAGEKSYYDILGVEQDVKLKQLKKAYRRSATKVHPDKRPARQDKKERAESEKVFIELTKAFDVLSDRTARKRYNYLLTQGVYTYDDDTDFSEIDREIGLQVPSNRRLQRTESGYVFKE